MTDYAQARESCVVFDQSSRGKAQVAGKDAASFLHNLSTNDIANLPLGGGCEVFFCNLKAKVVVHALIYHALLGPDEPVYWIDTAPGFGEKLVKHLDKFLIAEQVELADKTGEFFQVHLAGPTAKAVLQRALADEVPDLAPLQHMERTFGASVHSHIRRNDALGLPGYDIVCLTPLGPGLWRMLTECGATPASAQTYETLRVEAGTPEYGKDIDENRFAFDVGRTAITISYAKGCYLGQEPIVMARDRAGHAPRTLLGLKLGGNAPVERGAKVAHGDQEIGFVTSSVVSPRLGQPIALAYLRYGHQTPGTVMEVRATAGPVAAEVSALPFA